MDLSNAVTHESSQHARPHLSRALLRAARPRNGGASIAIGEIIENLGESSFGWCVLLFGLVNMMPMPLGSNMITALPLLVLTAQMAAGYHFVRLPRFIRARRLDYTGFRRLILAARRPIALLERLVCPRFEQVFALGYYRPMGAVLLLFSITLFLPIPLSGFITAAALFLAGLGLIERDGLITVAGLAVGVVAIMVTVGVGSLFVIGFNAVW